MNGSDIRSKLNGLGPKPNEAYTNQEIIDQLKELQVAIAQVVCDGEGDSIVRADTIVHAVEDRVNGLGLQNTDSFLSFKQDMEMLGRKIALMISGIRGEKKGFRALKPLEFDCDTRVLRNVCLKNDEGESEIDAIVVAPYGVFVIEIKQRKKPVVITADGFYQKVDNPDYQYPLGERMCCKEMLLREAMGTALDVPVYPVLFLVSDSEVTDHFGRVMTVNCNTAVYSIRSYAGGSTCLSSNRISEIVDSIEASRFEAKYPCRLDCERLIENFANLMDQIETAEERKETRVAEFAPVRQAKLKVALPMAVGLLAAAFGYAAGMLHRLRQE